MSHNGWRPARFDDFVPGMKRSNLSILIWTVLYLVNLGLVLLFQGVILYPITPPEEEILLHGHGYPDFSQIEYFEGCELLDMYGAGNYHYWILYRNPEGESRMVCISENDVLRRYRIDRKADTLISADAEVTVLTMDCTTHNRTFRILKAEQIDRELQAYKTKLMGSLLDGASKQMGLNLLIAAAILLVEYGLYEQFRRIVRGE